MMFLTNVRNKFTKKVKNCVIIKKEIAKYHCYFFGLVKLTLFGKLS